MEINCKTTVTLSEDDLKEVIRFYFESKEHKQIDANTIKFKYGQRLTGYGPTEGYSSYFDGCTFDLKG